MLAIIIDTLVSVVFGSAITAAVAICLHNRTIASVHKEYIETYKVEHDKTFMDGWNAGSKFEKDEYTRFKKAGIDRDEFYGR